MKETLENSGPMLKGFNDLANMKALAEDLLNKAQEFQVENVTIDRGGITFHATPRYDNLRVKLNPHGKFYVYSGDDQVAAGWVEGDGKIVYSHRGGR